MSDDIKDAVFEGAGPFAIPLLAEFVSIVMAKDKPDFVCAEFRLEDGATVYVPIASRAVGPLIDALGTLPAVRDTVVEFPQQGE
jgi:hypothetical protein